MTHSKSTHYNCCYPYYNYSSQYGGGCCYCDPCQPCCSCQRCELAGYLPVYRCQNWPMHGSNWCDPLYCDVAKSPNKIVDADEDSMKHEKDKLNKKQTKGSRNSHKKKSKNSPIEQTPEDEISSASEPPPIKFKASKRPMKQTRKKKRKGEHLLQTEIIDDVTVAEDEEEEGEDSSPDEEKQSERNSQTNNYGRRLIAVLNRKKLLPKRRRSRRISASKAKQDSEPKDKDSYQKKARAKLRSVKDKFSNKFSSKGSPEESPEDEPRLSNNQEGRRRRPKHKEKLQPKRTNDETRPQKVTKEPDQAKTFSDYQEERPSQKLKVNTALTKDNSNLQRTTRKKVSFDQLIHLENLIKDYQKLVKRNTGEDDSSARSARQTAGGRVRMEKVVREFGEVFGLSPNEVQSELARCRDNFKRQVFQSIYEKVKKRRQHRIANNNLLRGHPITVPCDSSKEPLTTFTKYH